MTAGAEQRSKREAQPASQRFLRRSWYSRRIDVFCSRWADGSFSRVVVLSFLHGESVDASRASTRDTKNATQVRAVESLKMTSTSHRVFLNRCDDFSILSPLSRCCCGCFSLARCQQQHRPLHAWERRSINI